MVHGRLALPAGRPFWLTFSAPAPRQTPEMVAHPDHEPTAQPGFDRPSPLPAGTLLRTDIGQHIAPLAAAHDPHEPSSDVESEPPRCPGCQEILESEGTPRTPHAIAYSRAEREHHPRAAKSPNGESRTGNQSNRAIEHRGRRGMDAAFDEGALLLGSHN